MNSARFLVAVSIVVGATLAACSGNFGSGTTPPNGLLPSGNLSGINPTPSPTPNSASNIVTYGSSAAFQPLPNAAGYGGAIAFTVPSPKPSGFADIAIGATLSLVSPSDAPDLNLLTKGKKGTKRERRARPLAYLTLLPTHDVTLEAFPRIAIDVPRDIVTTYRETEFGLALYNAGQKDSTYRLAVADLDTTSTPPPSPSPVASVPGSPTSIPLTMSPSPSASGSPVASPTPSPAALASGKSPAPTGSGASPSASASAGAAGPAASPTLPPQRIIFAGTATPLKLTANRPVVFALYAMPVETPSPGPKKSGAAAASAKEESAEGASPSAEGSGSPAPAKSGASSAPAASASATAAATAAGSAKP